MKKIVVVCLAITMLFAFVSCSSSGNEISSPESSKNDVSDSEADSSLELSTQGEESKPNSDNPEADEWFSKFDLNASFNNTDTTIVFTENNATVTGRGASADKTTVTITADGTYIVSGTCSNGQIIVRVSDTDKVRLVLNGLVLSNNSSAPIWVKSGDKVSICLAEGSDNVLTDAKKYTYDNVDEEPNACLFSKTDLTINGKGSLTVYGNCNNGIGSKDDLKIVSGNITVYAANNGLKGNDSVSIRDGVISIDSEDDGIKTTDTNKADKGFVYIRNGSITVKAGDDAIQATKNVTVLGGTVTTYAEGDSINCDGETSIAKGCVVVK